MYIISGDDEFDGGGETPDGVYNQIKRNYTDNMIVANVGVTIKLGKHEIPIYLGMMPKMKP